MIFYSLEFIAFMVLTLLGLGLLRGRNSLRKGLLLLASYYFYAYWDYRFLGLIILSTSADYVVGLRLVDARTAFARKGLLMISLCVNLGLLGVFKYYNFFIDSLAPLVGAVGFHTQTLDILLPVGISFYTFQTLSYTLDVYWGKMRPHENVLDFALFVAFFPQLVAGPIVRASHFLPQLRTYSPLTKENFIAGTQLFVIGLFKKVFLADRLALVSDVVFANAGVFDTATSWMGVLAYTMQIYFDFSGYSDMAIGVARILGYDLGENFNFPYLSKSPREFWRRWHISLSTWMRDYVYIPLGGSRSGAFRTSVNLFVTMLLCGLWHGPAWTFVLWGGAHGVAMIVNRKIGPNWEDGPLKSFLGWSTTMVFVVIGWVIFRATDFSQACLILRQMFFPNPGIHWSPFFVPLVLGGGAIVHGLHVVGKWKVDEVVSKSNCMLLTFMLILLGMVIVFHPVNSNPFIYFQF